MSEVRGKLSNVKIAEKFHRVLREKLLTAKDAKKSRTKNLSIRIPREGKRPYRARHDEGRPSRLAGVGESFEGVVDRRKDEEERLELGDLKQLGDAAVDSGEDDLLASLLSGDVCAHERAEAGGIDIGDLGEVQNERGRLLAPDGVLQGMEVVGRERAFEHKDSLACLGECTLDDEGIGVHRDERTL
jgi:hypothetical protein